MLPDEEKTFKDLKDKADRAEFQKIFWARRDPNLETPENEYQAAVPDALRNRGRHPDPRSPVGRARRRTADALILLLGKPDEVQEGVGRRHSRRARTAETWTYSDRPGGQTFTGGKAEIDVRRGLHLPRRATTSS